MEVLLQGDIREYEPEDFPRCDVICAGIPCTDHSLQGRSKKGLKVPEDGEVGNLYMDVLPVVRHHRPLCVVIENVPSYLTSEAGTNLVRTLSQWGYSVTSEVIDPLDWGEITSRKRCVIVATLRGHFRIHAPEKPEAFRLSDFLDPECPIQDRADAERDAHSVQFLQDRSKKMAAKGNGWRHRIIDREHLGQIPTITRGYMKRQPQTTMLRVPYGNGARLLRPQEIARIHGHTFPEDISATLSVETSGQGVMSRVFRDIFEKLAVYLDANQFGEAAIQTPKNKPEQSGEQLSLFVA